jgi:hypothetical protein
VEISHLSICYLSHGYALLSLLFMFISNLFSNGALFPMSFQLFIIESLQKVAPPLFGLTLGIYGSHFK